MTQLSCNTWKCFIFPGRFTSRKPRSRLCCVECQKEGFEKCRLLRSVEENPGSRGRPAASDLHFPAASRSYFCPALLNARRLFDGCELSFCACKWKKKKKSCVWMLVMGKSWYCITVFDYHPLCWTEWRLLGGRFSQNMRSCFQKLLQLKFTNIPPTATRDKSTHTHTQERSWEWMDMCLLGCCGHRE